MLTYENIKKTLNEQEDEILVKIHNKYCEEKDKMYLYIYNNTPDNVEMLLPEQRYECLLEGQYIRDTYIQSDKWMNKDILFQRMKQKELYCFYPISPYGYKLSNLKT